MMTKLGYLAGWLAGTGLLPHGGPLRWLIGLGALCNSRNLRGELLRMGLPAMGQNLSELKPILEEERLQGMAYLPRQSAA